MLGATETTAPTEPTTTTENGSGGGNNGGGGGSGYHLYRSLQVSSGTVLTAQVGDQNQFSRVTLNNNDTYRVHPGQAGQGPDGGDGYCGGGGEGSNYGGCCSGGTDGGDGDLGSRGSGGHGIGEDVSSFTFNTWKLEPGMGGEVYYEGHYYYGGGGGGVLLNRAGPQHSPYQGQGYGAGASGSYDYGIPMPGVILIEIN